MQHPELAGAKRVVFSVRKATVDSLGHLVDCELTAFVKRGQETEDLPSLAEEMAEKMKAHHPWQTYLIYGEYKAFGTERWGFAYPLVD